MVLAVLAHLDCLRQLWGFWTFLLQQHRHVNNLMKADMGSTPRRLVAGCVCCTQSHLRVCAWNHSSANTLSLLSVCTTVLQGCHQPQRAARGPGQPHALPVPGDE